MILPVFRSPYPSLDVPQIPGSLKDQAYGKINYNTNLVSPPDLPFPTLFSLLKFVAESTKPAILLQTNVRTLFEGFPSNLPIATGAQNQILTTMQDSSQDIENPVDLHILLIKIRKMSAFSPKNDSFFRNISNLTRAVAKDRFAGKPWKRAPIHISRERSVLSSPRGKFGLNR